MSVKINYEYETVTIPAKAIPAMERASSADIRLLMAFCADSTLRTLPENDFASFAKAAGCSETQAAASMAFWRGAGILITDKSSTGTPSAKPTVDAVSHPEAVHTSEPTPAPEPMTQPTSSGVTDVEPAPTPAAKATEETRDGGREEPVRTSKPGRHDQLPIYTTEQVTAILENRPDTAEFLDESTHVWGKMFNTHEINILLGLVDYLGLDWEYVLILLAYCRKMLERRGSSKSLHYVETVAFGFYDEGICTPEALQEKIRQLDLMAETESRLRKLFGIGERTLTANEKRYFSVWLYEYKYSMEIIQKAYEITVDAIGEPKLKYMNAILSKWSAEKLTTVEAIEVFQAKEAQAGGKGKGSTQPGSSFDTDDFFGDAVRRNFGDDFDPDKMGQ